MLLSTTGTPTYVTCPKALSYCYNILSWVKGKFALTWGKCCATSYLWINARFGPQLANVCINGHSGAQGACHKAINSIVVMCYVFFSGLVWAVDSGLCVVRVQRYGESDEDPRWTMMLYKDAHTCWSFEKNLGIDSFSKSWFCISRTNTADLRPHFRTSKMRVLSNLGLRKTLLMIAITHNSSVQPVQELHYEYHWPYRARRHTLFAVKTPYILLSLK